VKLALRGTAAVPGAMLFRGAALLLGLIVGALMALVVGCADEASPPTAPSSSVSTATAAATATATAPPTTSAQTGGAAAGYTITAEETKRLLDGGAPVVVVDVRSASNFGKSHLKGALSIPVDDLLSRYGEIPTGSAVIVCASCT